MPNIKLIVIVFGFIGWGSCQNGIEESSIIKQSAVSNTVNLTAFDWIIGDWEGEYNNQRLSESWKKLSNLKLKGKTYSISTNDTTCFEILTLEVIENTIFYSTDVSKNKNIVSFKLVNEKPNQFIFKNETNDFPSRIQYTYQEPDNLHIEISGKENGNRKKLDFYFKKLIK